MLKLVLIVMVCVAAVAALPINDPPAAAGDFNEPKAWDYLQRFGYIKRQSQPSSESYEAGMQLFQRTNKLEQTGSLDEATVGLMNSPRCGYPDFHEQDDLENAKLERYTTFGSKWPRNALTFRVTNDNNDGILRATVEATMQNMLNKWAAVTPLSFTMANSGEDISIRFAYIDGRLGTLAYAYEPENGDVTFDQDDDFKNHINFEFVAEHEFGHSLGLRHSSNQGAVMYAWYHDSPPDLSQDDIDGIQSIYGKNT